MSDNLKVHILSQLDKLKKQNKETNDKEVKELMKDVEKSTKTNTDIKFKPVKKELTKKQKEEVDVFNRGFGMEDLKYDSEPDDLFKQRMEKNMDDKGDFSDGVGKEMLRRAEKRKEYMDSGAGNRFNVTLKDKEKVNSTKKKFGLKESDVVSDDYFKNDIEKNSQNMKENTLNELSPQLVSRASSLAKKDANKQGDVLNTAKRISQANQFDKYVPNELKKLAFNSGYEIHKTSYSDEELMYMLVPLTNMGINFQVLITPTAYSITKRDSDDTYFDVRVLPSNELRKLLTLIKRIQSKIQPNMDMKESKEYKLKTSVTLNETTVMDILPEKYKVEGNKISLTNGEQTLKFIWENNKPKFIDEKTEFYESIKKTDEFNLMKKLWSFNSREYNERNRLDENKNVKTILDKSKGK